MANNNRVHFSEGELGPAASKEEGPRGGLWVI